ncbi:hypothetical protein PIB30_054555, partial [Stylosanthes scabra]|nr:hypothetical protein [Stylosanthes scabra]
MSSCGYGADSQSHTQHNPKSKILNLTHRHRRTTRCFSLVLSHGPLSPARQLLGVSLAVSASSSRRACPCQPRRVAVAVSSPRVSVAIACSVFSESSSSPSSLVTGAVVRSHP